MVPGSGFRNSRIGSQRCLSLDSLSVQELGIDEVASARGVYARSFFVVLGLSLMTGSATFVEKFPNALGRGDAAAQCVGKWVGSFVPNTRHQ